MEIRRSIRVTQILLARIMAAAPCRRLARSDDLDIDATRGEPGPPGVVFDDTAAMIVGNLDRSADAGR